MKIRSHQKKYNKAQAEKKKLKTSTAKFRSLAKSNLELRSFSNLIKSSSLVAQIIANKTNLNKSDKVLEICTGTGKITKALALRVNQVLTVGKDKALMNKLKTQLDQFENIKFFLYEFLDFNLHNLGSYKVFTNISFNQVSEVVRKLFFSTNPPKEAYIIMPHATYKRFVGEDKDLTVQLPAKILPFFDWSIIHRFDKEDFSPPPRINVVMAKIVMYENHKISSSKKKYYWDFVDYVFSKYKGTIKSGFRDLFTDEQLKRLGSKNGFQLHDNIQKIKPAIWVDLFDYMVKGGVSEIKQQEIKKFKYYKKLR